LHAQQKHNPLALNANSLFVYFVTGIVYAIIGPNVPAMSREFGVSLGSMGILFICQLGGCFAAVFAGGMAVDRFGPKRVLLTGMALLTGGLAAAGGAVCWLMLTAGFLLLGLGLGCIDASANALVAQVNPRTAARNLGLLHAFFGVGAVAAPVPAAALLGHTGSYRPAFFIAAGLSAIGGIIYAALRAPRHTRTGESPFRALRGLFRNRRFVLLALFLLPCMGTEMAVNGWLSTYLKKELHTGMSLAATGVSVYWAGLLLGRLLGSALAVRVGAERMLWAHAATQVVATVALVASPSAAVTIAAACLLGFAISADFPLAVAIISAEEKDAPGAATGGLFAAGGLGATIIPASVGFVAERASLRIGLAMFIPLAVVMVALLALRGKRTMDKMPNSE